MNHRDTETQRSEKEKKTKREEKKREKKRREEKKREGHAGAAGVLFLGMDHGERRKKKKHGKRLEAADTTINPTVLEIISSKIT